MLTRRQAQIIRDVLRSVEIDLEESAIALGHPWALVDAQDSVSKRIVMLMTELGVRDEPSPGGPCDTCRMSTYLGEPAVEHDSFCNEYAAGTITSVITGEILRPAF